MNGLALCAGIGGLELGLRLVLPARYATVCFVERDAFAAAVLVARMADATLDPAPVWDDLATFDGRPWRGVVDIVSAGFPCQPFSAAGKRLGKADDRWLWPEIARIVAEVEPALVFLENVPGLVRHGLRDVWADLRGMGYDVQAELFSAAEVGAPHRRQRLFVLAHADGGGRQGERIAERAGVEGAQGDEPIGSHLDGRLDRAPQSAEPDERSTWPPTPGSRTWDGPQPALRRMAHGLPYRSDQLRALGNGVVPLVAAYAFRTLAASLRSRRSPRP